MILRLAVLVSLGCLAVAGPVSWDDSKCSQACNGGSKYQYSQQTSYIYSYETSNELQAERASELLTKLRATVKLTAVSKCEMVLEVSDVRLQHGPVQDTSSALIEQLQRNPLPFSWDDGVIEHVCPNPDDSDEVNNIKKAIISSFQNSMRAFDVGLFNTETDILGTCDTNYKTKEQGHEKYEILKTKNIPSCTNHLKGQTIFLATPYQSAAHPQHIPFLTNEKSTCKQIIDSGIVEEVTCDESSAFKPLSDYGYVVNTKGHSHLKKLSSQAASRVIYKTSKKENLVYKYQAHSHKNPNAESDARNVLQHICENSKDLITKEAASYVHKLVYTIRQMSTQSVENVYSALKNGEICSTGKKAQTIYLDALRMASSGGSMALLTKLTTSGEIPYIDSILWMTLLPFTSYVEEESISALLPLLKKDTANRQTILGITALAFKYCSANPDCESSQAIKDLSSRLKEFLGNKCHAESQEDETQVLTALKGFGNLGYFGDSAKDLFECALTGSNKVQLRVAAIDAFRRSPCSEGVSSKLLEIYSTKTEHDEIRIAALISLFKCVSNGIVDKVVEVYSTETSRQVEVFTWSLLTNLESTSDPTKAKIYSYNLMDLKEPSSVDITKFSRNFQLSLHSALLNLGELKEANIIHSSDSFLPRSGSLVQKLNIFGNQLDAFEIGGRVEDMEHILEKLFGPVGILSHVNLENLVQLLPQNLKRSRRSADSYESKIDSLSERLGYKRNKVPHATGFVRVMGHELGLIHLNEESLQRIAGLKANDFLKNLANLRDVDTSKNLFFMDVSVLFPSVTGRAYKLASNGSLTFGFKGQGKIDLRQPSFPIPKADIDGKFQPSLLGEITAAFTIHSEDFEPGVKVETVFNAGVDYQAKIELKNGRLIHVKLNRERKRSEILNLKRTLYYMNHKGQTEMEKPPSHNLNYCSKYVQKITGAKVCASLTIPHAFTDGKFKIPFVRELEASIVVEQTDSSMDGYEFFLEIPEIGKSEEKRFKLLLDTPNSSEDRKLSIEVNMKQPDESTCSLSVNLHTPIYSLDIESKMENTDKHFDFSISASGDGKRNYSFKINGAKVVKGARLVEYQPHITIEIPSVRPVDMTGTIVFSKGRKAQIAVNLESKSFSSPFTIKGNLAKEGETIDISSNWKLNYDFNANVFSQIHRFHGALGYQVGNGLFIDLGHHYEPDGRSYESITVNAKVENIKILGRLSFSIDSQVLFAEHQDLNTMLKWDFSFKPLHHLKNDFIFRYGENFEDDTHLVRLTILSALHGDLNSLHKLNIENKLGLTISCLDFDKSASLSVAWDFVDEPKLMIDAGIKTDKDKQIKLDLNYRHIKSDKNPLKMATDFKFIYNKFQFKYTDEATEVSPRVFQWKSVIEPTEGKEITTDFMYYIKSEGNFHHELEGSIKFPGLSQPVKQKGMLLFSDRKLKLSSHTEMGPRNFYSLDVQLEREGTNEIKLNTPFLEGSVHVEAKGAERSVRADFKSKGKDNRRILASGSVTPGDTNTLELEVQWDADKDAQKKVNIMLTSSRETEDGVEKHIIGGSVNYAGSINVDISGTINTDLLRGPHFFRTEFSGSMEPMAVEIEHEIKDGQMISAIRYIRSGVEKIRQDIKGTFIYHPYSHLEIGGGIFTHSPYKTFDGKVLTFRLFANSNDDARTFKSSYQIKVSPAIGYEGKLDYERKRGWPGNIRSNLLVTAHNRPMYEGSTHVDYGNGKYSWKTSFTPLTRKKINFLTSFEHSARFAAFHHSVATSLQYLQTIDLNVVADLRNMEDAKINSNMDINTHKLYDINGTIKMRSIFDFDAEARLFSKITPSLKVFSKAQSSGQISKYEFNLDVDSNSIITGSGELKKRKRGFNGDIVFKYKEKEILVLTLQQDGKGKHERNYLTQLRFPSRLYTANVKVNKEQKGIINYETKFCRNENLCIEIDVMHKEYDIGNEWQITYKRDDISFSIERIRESTKEYERFHTVVYKDQHRYGYDVRLGSEGPGRSLSLGVILPSREIVTKGTVEFSFSNPKIKLEFSADARKHPERKLITDVSFENHLRDSEPSKLHITFTHPIFEKPIEIELSGDYQPSKTKYFSAVGSLDYSNTPDDKLIGKLTIEEFPSGSEVILMNVYHRDENHLDFVIKVNATSNSNEMSFAVVYNWKDENYADEEAYMVAKLLEKENRFSFEYRRPKLTYSLEGKILSSDALLNDTYEVDLVSVYNGEPTKGKLAVYGETGCFKLTILHEEEVSRVAELCVNPQSRKLVSLLTESFDDEGHWTLDYLMEMIQKDWNTIGFRQQMNPEFTGATLFKLTSFIDELDEAGVGSLPFYDSPRFKIIRQSFSSKVFNPAKEFIIPEAQAFIHDIVTDVAFLRAAAIQYYNQMPSLEVVIEKIQEARAFIRSIAYEIWKYIYSYNESYIRPVFVRIERFGESIQEKCQNNNDCRSLVRSYQTGGLKALLQELRALLLSLPDKIEKFIEDPGDDFKNNFKNLINTLKTLLEPLTKYRCGEIVVKVVKLSYEALEPPVQAFLNRAPIYYKRIKDRLSTNEYVKAAFQVMKEGYLRIRKEILSIDYKKLVSLVKVYFEDYLSTVSLPSKERYVTVNAFNIEKGVIDVDVHTYVANRIGNKIKYALLDVVDKSMYVGRNYNWNTILIKFKRGLDFNFIPPYDVQGVMVAHQHFVTFDKAFYDFAGECSYLLTRDFEDGNFTIVLKPKEGDHDASVLVFRGGKSVELSSGRKSVKVDDNGVELPYLSKELAVTREGHTIVVDTKNGLQVKCNLVHQICTFDISGWYYGKTAGLLGTYNYEDHDEFKRPKGHIANSVNVFAKSWELKKGCKSNNLVSDVQINKNSEYYKLCKSHFKSDASPLAACFSEVPVDQYYQLCLRHLASEKDHTSALCNVAAAYVAECEKNYVELNLPSKCLTCDAPDGSKLDHGDRKKFENMRKKSADTIFIIEDHECNKVIMNDLGNLARSIERELQSEGYKDNLFGVVGFGGEIGDPQTFTAKDKIFFGSRDINTVSERFKLENQKVEPSKAFEAIKHAVTHHSRGEASKSFVLLSCSACQYDYTSLQYPVVQQILLERGISLHIIRKTEIRTRKSSKEKSIIGVDPDTVFHTKDVTQSDLVGEPDLRSQVVMPKDLCIALSQDVNGSFFSTHPLSQSSSGEIKNWRSVFSRKLLKSTQLFNCQWCDCTSTRDHLPNTVCQPCEIKRPRLPFSVGSSNAKIPRTVEAFISYLIHMLRE